MNVLNDLGLIERRPGVGTVIVSKTSEQSFVQMVKEPAELMRHPDQSRLRVFGSKEVKLNRALAAQL